MSLKHVHQVYVVSSTHDRSCEPSDVDAGHLTEPSALSTSLSEIVLDLKPSFQGTEHQRFLRTSPSATNVVNRRSSAERRRPSRSCCPNSCGDFPENDGDTGHGTALLHTCCPRGGRRVCADGAANRQETWTPPSIPPEVRSVRTLSLRLARNRL